MTDAPAQTQPAATASTTDDAFDISKGLEKTLSWMQDKGYVYTDEQKQKIRDIIENHTGFASKSGGFFAWVIKFIQALTGALDGKASFDDALKQATASADAAMTATATVQGLGFATIALKEAGIQGAEFITGVQANSTILNGRDTSGSLNDQILSAKGLIGPGKAPLATLNPPSEHPNSPVFVDNNGPAPVPDVRPPYQHKR